MNPWLMQGIGEENAAFVVGAVVCIIAAVVLVYFIAKAGWLALQFIFELIGAIFEGM